MGFWEKYNPQPQQQSPQRGGGPWWQGPAPTPQQVVSQPAPQQVSYQPSNPDGEVSMGELLRQGDYTTNKAKSALQTDRCPNCSSGNYMSPDSNVMHTRCFDCGFNPFFEQQAAGIQNARATGQVRRSRGNFESLPGMPPKFSVIQHV